MPSNFNNLNLNNNNQKTRTTTIERGVRIVNGGGSGDDSVEHNHSLNSVSILMKQKRDQEKQALTQLNDRFAKYIDRVKFLENQNKKLQTDLDLTRRNWSDNSRLIREHYEPELLEARSNIDQITRDSAESEIKTKRNEYDIQNLKRQYDEACQLAQTDKSKIGCLEQLLRDNDSECELLKAQMSDIETNISKYKNEIKRLNTECDRLLSDLDQETLRRVKIENEKQTLEEQIPFMKAVHEQEMAELRVLTSNAHAVDPNIFYRHELERAVRDIRNDFEDLSQQHKRELEEWYKVKTEEIETTAARRVDQMDSTMNKTHAESPISLRSALNDQMSEYKELLKQNSEHTARLSRLEDDLDQTRRDYTLKTAQYDRDIHDLNNKYNDLVSDYDELMNSKVSIEFEINAYRRLLESEETRGVR
jgi:intermediate filament protein if